MIEEKFMVFWRIKYQNEYGKTYIFNQLLDYSEQSEQERSNFYQCDDNLEWLSCNIFFQQTGVSAGLGCWQAESPRVE